MKMDFTRTRNMLRKQFFCVLLAFLLAWPVSLQQAAGAAEPAGLELNCKAAAIIDVSSGQILYESNAEAKLAPASITKVMSALLICEAIESGKISYDTVVTGSPEANKMGGSQIWLEVGEQMTVDQLFKAVMVGSANDATVALAEAVAGSEQTFVELMNFKAQELGMTQTHFMNAAGLDDENHYTTAKDVAIMSRELLKHQQIQKYTKIWMDSLRDGKTELVNTNKLVRFYDGITGLKTGTTSKAGNCLVASAERGGLHVAAVIMGCTNNNDRYGGAQKMLDYAFANFSSIKPEDVTPTIEPMKVLHGVQQKVGVYGEVTQNLIMKKGAEQNLEYKISIAGDVMAPVEKGQIVGTVKIMSGAEEVGEYDVKCAEDIPKMNLSKALGMLFSAFVKL